MRVLIRVVVLILISVCSQVLCESDQVSIPDDGCEKPQDGEDSSMLQTLSAPAGSVSISLPLSNDDANSSAVNLKVKKTGLMGPEEKAYEHSGRVDKFHYWLHKGSLHHRDHRGNQSHKQHSEMPVWEKVAGIAGASLATLSINLVDVIWIMPFIMSKVNGFKNAMIYITVCQFFLAVSMVIAALRSSAQGHSDASRNVDIVATTLLTAYAIYLLLEEFVWAHEAPTKSSGDVPEGTPEETAPECQKEQQQKHQTSGQFLVLAVLGSVDQIAVYVPVLGTKALSTAELEIGGMVSTLFSVGVCYFLSEFACIMRFAEAIPLWLIVLVLAAASFGQLVWEI